MRHHQASQTAVLLLLAAVLGAALATRAPAQQPPATQPTPDEDSSSDGLIKRLRDGSTGGEDISARIDRLMDASRRRLAEDFDTGDPTQSVQREIILELEAAIDIAKQNLRKGSPSSASPQQKGEKREQGKRQQKQDTKTDQGRSADATEQPPSAGGDPAGSAPGDASVPQTRSWGNLPDRDREAVIQGFKEDFLRKYGELIEQYYRALSEEAEE